MRVSLDWVSLVVLAGVFIGAFLAVLLFAFKKGNRPADLFLGAFLLAYSMANLGTVPWQAGIIGDHPHWFGLFMPFVFAMGPLLYFYILALTRPGRRFKPGDFLHFAPYAAVLAAFSVLVYFRGAEYKLGLIDQINSGRAPWGITAYLGGRIVHILIYLALCATTLAGYGRTLKENFSDIERINLNWLRLMLAAYGTGVVAVVILAQLDVPDKALHIWETVVVLIIGMRGLTQTQIFGAGRLPEPPAAKPAPKYQRSSLTLDQAEKAERLLRAVMETDKLFLEEDLSLKALADHVGLSPAYVSQVLNERLKRNFFDFVNGYRVEEAKRRLSDPRRGGEKILTIALDVGFNSKAAFNRVFKKTTGRTPSEYKGERSSA